MPDDQERKGWWQTVPGVLTAIAGIITASTGLVVALRQTGMLGVDDSAQNQPKGSLSVAADVIAGKWSGTAKDEGGASFQVEIDIKNSCALGEKCGSIRVSHVPCYGDLFLYKVENNDFEFRVDNFSNGSNASCTPGPGDHFTKLPDGTLLYTTTYSGARGILKK